MSETSREGPAIHATGWAAWLAAIVLVPAVTACDGTGTGDRDADAGDGEETVDVTGDGESDADADTGTDPDGGDGDPTECTSASDCDDSDPCTVDACDGDTDLCTHEPVDADGDGFPAAEVEGAACGGTDCDDDDGDVYPGADPDCTGTRDLDCDGRQDSDADGDGHAPEVCGGDDCDDDDEDAFPGSLADPCAIVDLDCNGHPENDNDGDGGVSASCTGGDDCDDADPDVFHGAVEDTCNGRDDNCDGEMALTEDGDQDGWANPGCGGDDCDDGDEDIHPGAAEVCDVVDQDCDGTIFDAAGIDPDGDGVPDAACGGADCDETDPSVHGAFVPAAGVTDPPVAAAAEVCDDVDDDCNGTALDAPGADDDADDYLDAACGGDDCDDEEDGTYPGAAAVCGVDADCDTVTDGDGDEDGYLDVVLCGGDDCDDGNDQAHPGADEICANGVDEDCDGEADGIKLMVDPVLVSANDGTASYQTRIVWTGSDYGVVYTDVPGGSSQEIMSNRISADGSTVSSTRQVTHHLGSSDGNLPDVVWTGSDYGITWRDTRDGNSEIYLARLATSGLKTLSDLRITDDAAVSSEPRIAYSGSTFGIVFSDNRGGDSSVYVAVVSDSGTKLSSDVEVPQGTTAADGAPHVAWSGSRWGVVWNLSGSSDHGAYMGLVHADGTPVGGSTHWSLDSPVGSASGPTVQWSGSEFGTVWFDNRASVGDVEIFFQRMSTLGTRIGSNVRVTSAAGMSARPEISWAGDMYGIVWYDFRDGYSEIYFTAVDPLGASLATDLRLTDHVASSENPVLAWSGSEFGVAWQDQALGTTEVFFTRVAFCE